MAEHTLAYARGEISDAAFAADPGLEPVWVELLHITRRLLAPVSPEDLALAHRLYTTPPRHYWLDGRLVPAERVARDRIAH